VFLAVFEELVIHDGCLLHHFLQCSVAKAIAKQDLLHVRLEAVEEEACHNFVAPSWELDFEPSEFSCVGGYACFLVEPANGSFGREFLIDFSELELEGLEELVERG